LQAISECEGPFEDNGLAPPMVHNRKMSGKSLSNKSSLNIGTRAACGKRKNSHSNKKGKQTLTQYGEHTQSELKLLLKSINATVSGLKNEHILRLKENEVAREVEEMNNTQMQGKCSDLEMPTSGNTLSLRLRLSYHHFRSASVAHQSVDVAMDQALSTAVAEAVAHPLPFRSGPLAYSSVAASMDQTLSTVVDETVAHPLP